MVKFVKYSEGGNNKKNCQQHLPKKSILYLKPKSLVWEAWAVLMGSGCWCPLPSIWMVQRGWSFCLRMASSSEGSLILVSWCTGTGDSSRNRVFVRAVVF